MKTYLQIVSQEFSTFHYFWLLTALLFFIFHKSFFNVWFPFEVSKGAFALMSCSFLALGTRKWPLVFKCGNAPLVQWPSSPCALCQHSCSFDWKLLWVKYKPWNMAQEGRLWWSEKGYVQPGKRLGTSRNRREFCVPTYPKDHVCFSSVAWKSWLTTKMYLMVETISNLTVSS